MMKTFSFYHRESGVVHHQRFGTDTGDEQRRERQLAANTPADHVAIEAVLDHLSQRVDLTGETPAVVDYQPPAPSTDHEWNAETKRWQLKPEVAQRQAERERAFAKIRALESSQPRAVREAVLGQAGAVERLAAIDKQIAELRKDFVPLGDAPSE